MHAQPMMKSQRAPAAKPPPLSGLKCRVSFLTERRLHIVRTDHSLAFWVSDSTPLAYDPGRVDPGPRARGRGSL
jgi:hypothetical protein